MKPPRDTSPASAHLRMIRGTARKDRPAPAGVVLPILGAPPEPPAWMTNADALAEWAKLCRLLPLSEGQLSALGVLCQLHGKIVALFRMGDVPTGSLLAMHRSLSNDFGLSPRAQNRLHRLAGNASSNPFAGRGKRPD